MEPSSFGNDCRGMKSRVNAKLVLCLTLLLGASYACGPRGDITPGTEEQFGSMEITATTTGTNHDADGYIVGLDEGSEQAIGINATVTISQLAARRWQIELQGVATNCVVAGQNPRNVQVTAGGTAEDVFLVACT